MWFFWVGLYGVIYGVRIVMSMNILRMMSLVIDLGLWNIVNVCVSCD